MDIKKFSIKDYKVKEDILKLKNVIRAEFIEDNNFCDSFAGKELVQQIENKMPQIIYGRGGAGKTHLLRTLQEKLSSTKGNLPIYIDIRKIKPLMNEDIPVYYALILFKFIFMEIL